MSVNRIDAHSLLEPRVQKAQQWWARQILVDARPLTPIDTSRMVNTPVIMEKGTLIRYTVPYARYQYEGVTRHPPFRPLVYQSPTAVDHWIEKAAEYYGDSWLEGIREIIARGT